MNDSCPVCETLILLVGYVYIMGLAKAFFIPVNIDLKRVFPLLLTELQNNLPN